MEAFTIIEENVHAVLSKGQGKVLYASLAAAFWISSMAVQSLARSLDLANGYVRRYAFWKVLIRDLGVTLLFMLVIPLSLFLPIIEKALYRVVTYYDTIEEWQGWFYIWPNVKWGLGTLFLFLFFLLFYKVVPTGKMKFKEAFPGAVFSAIGWQLFSLVFGSYVSNVDYTRLYGQLSGIILLVTLVLFYGSHYFDFRFVKCGMAEVIQLKEEENIMMKILVVDDDPNILELVSIQLTQAGYTVLKASMDLKRLRYWKRNYRI